MTISISQAYCVPHRHRRLCYWGPGASCNLKLLAAKSLSQSPDSIVKVIRYGWRAKRCRLPNGAWLKMMLQRVLVIFANGSHQVHLLMPDIMLPYFSTLTTDAWAALKARDALSKEASCFNRECYDLGLQLTLEEALMDCPGRLKRLAAITELIEHKIRNLKLIAEQKASSVMVLRFPPYIVIALPFPAL